MEAYFQIFKHRWLMMWRSPIWAKNILSLLFNAFGFVMLLFTIPFLGYYFEEVFMQFSDGMYDTIDTFILGVFKYFGTAFVFLLLSMNVSQDNLQTYWLLPKYKSALIRIMLLKPIMNSFQRMFLLFTIPFAYKYVYDVYGLLATLSFLLGLNMMHIIMSLSIYIIKKRFAPDLLRSFLWIIAIVTGIYFLSLLEFDLSSLFLDQVNGLIGLDWTLLSILTIATFLVIDRAYKITAGFLNLDQSLSVAPVVKKEKSGIGENLLGKLPIEYVFLIRLMGYNQFKRPSFIFAIIFHFIFVILYLYQSDFFDTTLSLMMYYQLFGSILIISIFPQFFMFTSSYMDGLISRNFDLTKLLKLHYRLLVVIYFALIIVWLPLIYSTKHFWLLISLSLFHSGFSACVYLLNTYAFTGRVEIGSKRNIGNGKLIGGSMATLMFIWLITIFLYLAVGTVFGYSTALWSIAIVGLVFLVLHPIWISEIIQHFEHNKYQRLINYRAK